MIDLGAIEIGAIEIGAIEIGGDKQSDIFKTIAMPTACLLLSNRLFSYLDDRGVRTRGLMIFTMISRTSSESIAVADISPVRIRLWNGMKPATA